MRMIHLNKARMRFIWNRKRSVFYPFMNGFMKVYIEFNSLFDILKTSDYVLLKDEK